ncbi:hypothetical protein IL54_4830 [Sphingobium sp. ba1]|nr:hypothetical protein IL54_4830 [Sphingobium sp. ba1]
MEKTLGRGVIAMGQPVAAKVALVIARIAIVEAVGQDEIDDLILRQARAKICGSWRGGGCGQGGGGQRHQRGEQHGIALWHSSSSSGPHWPDRRGLMPPS